MTIAHSAPTLSITDALLAKVCRATPDEAHNLSLSLSMADRAKLAIFCNAKSHLRSHGRAIASACTEASLVEVGGLAGEELLRQAALRPDTWGEGQVTLKKQVSLAGLRF